jgi:DNA polymerase III delta subunit
MFHIQNELDKLINWAETNQNFEILEKDVELITFGLSDINNFEFFDVLFVDKNKALKLIAGLQEEGAAWNSIL